jgi:hypothetical protein
VYRRSDGRRRSLKGQRIVHSSMEQGIRDRFFVHKRIVSAVRRVEFVNDRMSYIILRGRWCNIIVLNVHATCEDKSDDV